MGDSAAAPERLLAGTATYCHRHRSRGGAGGHYHPAVRIAILEDDPDQLALLQRWLVQDGHDVHGYTSGRETMLKAARESFDLFLLDWQVPDVPGTEVLQWLRGNVSRKVPVLFGDQGPALKLGEGALPETPAGELAEIAARISAAERRAMAAERETVDRLIAHHLADQIGARFEARISGVTKSGLFVRLSDTGADGFVPAATLGREYYAYDEAAHALTSRSGVSYRLAAMVEVRLIEAAPIAGALRFEVVGGGGKRTPPPFRKGERWRDRTSGKKFRGRRQ